MITVVSGLPRSGTSLMMQILETCGLPILCDNIRQPDSNNPHGYYEDERVKTLHNDNAWMGEAENRVVKIVSHQLIHINPQYEYRVIFILRNLNEIIQSQNVMMRTKTTPPGVHGYYSDHITKTLDWLDSNKVPYIKINYNQLITDPGPELSRLPEFLGAEIPIKGVIQTIDTSLWRNRNHTTPLK